MVFFLYEGFQITSITESTSNKSINDIIESRNITLNDYIAVNMKNVSEHRIHRVCNLSHFSERVSSAIYLTEITICSGYVEQMHI